MRTTDPGVRSPAREDAPVIVRLGGLPFDVVAGLSGSLCEGADALEQVREQLEAARAAAVETLYDAVPATSPELRPFLLAVKRDCHNGRALGARAGDARWQRLAAAPRAAAGRVLALEAEADAARERFEAGYASEVQRQRDVLWTTAADPAFARGLALASPDLSAALQERQASPAGRRHRRERKTEASLLRYVTRASTKLSPFSTLTPVGLGVARDLPSRHGLRLAPRPWRTRSLVRLSRYLPERLVHLLARYAPFRAGMYVALNPSLEEAAPGRHLLLRPRRWVLDEASGKVRFEREAMATVSVQGPLLTYLEEALRGGARTYGGLAGIMAESLGAGGDAAVREQLDRLVDIGVLQLAPPWQGHAVTLERRLLECLRTLPQEPRLRELVVLLERLGGFQEGYAGAPDPLDSIRGIRALVPALYAAAARLAALDPESLSEWPDPAHAVTEDVYVQPERAERRAPAAAVAEVPRAAMDEALRAGRALVRLSVLFEDRLEFRHTLAAFARQKWPRRGSVGVLESLDAAQPLWQSYTRFHFARPSGTPREARTWNPLALPELEALHCERVRVLELLPECARRLDGEDRFCPDALDALLDTVSGGFADAGEWGAMLHFQAARADGSLWVLNQFTEGTGRYGSRYTAAMDDRTREFYTAHLSSRAHPRIDGEPAAPLDVLCVQGSTLNVHAPQTPGVLDWGEGSGVPGSRRVPLDQLRISFCGPGGLPRVRGRDGRLHQPVNLGFAAEAHMPTLLRYLCTFGPSELRGVLPRRASRGEGTTTVSGRTTVGSLVVHRRRWSVPAEPLRQALDGAGDAAGFAAVHRIRTAAGLPGQGFIQEIVRGPAGRSVGKPQYLDLTSPLFLPILRGALSEGDALVLTELLPGPEACPVDEHGRRWMAELMLDSTTFRGAARSAGPRTRTERRGAMASTPAADLTAA